MIPHRRLVLLLAALAGLALGVAVGWIPVAVWQALLGALLLLALVDLLLAARRREPALQRIVPGSFPLGVASRVELSFANHTARALRARVYDHHPAGFRCADLPLDVVLPARRVTRVRYRVTPAERGVHAFAAAQCRLRSPLGLWWRERRLGAAQTVRVYPNFAAVTRYALLALEQRLPVIGVQKQRRRGEGSEFHQLREYRPGDALAQIDWRATARMRKLIAREYQDERNQTVLFLLDCGRRMRARDGELSHFDQALNAVLLMAYVALRSGDSVGVATFGGAARWLAAGKGRGSLDRMLNMLFDLQPTPQAPDYSQAATELLRRQRKRALVVIVTNLRDDDTGDLEAGLGVLRHRHLVLLVSLRERSVEDTLQRRPETFEAALQTAAAWDYAYQRERVLDRVRGRGVLSLDVLPQQLSVQLVNQYLAIKAQGIL